MKLHPRSAALLLAPVALASCEKQEPVLEQEAEAIEIPSQPGDAIIARLDRIIIPVIDFEDTSVEEAIDFLRVRSLELDKEGDPGMRGISIIIRRGRMDANDDGLDDSGLDIGGIQNAQIVRYQARNVSLLKALTQVCEQAKLNAYLTSVGIVICPETDQPFPNPKGETGGIVKKLTP